MKNFFLLPPVASLWNLVGQGAAAIALCFMTGLPGCGSSTPPSPPNTAANSSAPGGPLDVPSAVDQPASGMPSADSTPTQPAAEVSSAEAVKDLDSLTEASTPAVVGQAPPAAQTPVAPPVPPATAEQLARWKIAPSDPLQLLVCNDTAEIGFVSKLATTPDGKNFLLAGSQVTLWSPLQAEPEHTFLNLANEQNRRITALAVAPDGTWFCAGDSQGKLYVWSLSDRRSVTTQTLYDNDITQIAIAPAGDEIATMTYNQEVTIWETNGWTKKHSFTLDTRGVERMAYMGPQRLVAAGETTSLWDTTVGKLERQLSPGRYQFAMSATPDAQYFAVGTEAGLQFWSVAKLSPGVLLEGDFRGAQLAFSKNQPLLASCAGRDIYIYQLAERQLIQVLEASGPAIVGLAWLTDSQTLVNVSELGRIRVWGDQRAADKLQLQPMHSPVELAGLSDQQPANASQLLAALELRTLPRLPAAKVTLASDTMVAYSAPGTVADAKAFYHHLLGTLGWQAQPADPYTPDYLTFKRHTIELFISLTQSGQQVEVNLTNLGNMDVRKLPKFDEANSAIVYENASTSSYTTQADLLSIETGLLRQMSQAGWVAVARLNASSQAEPDVRDLEFYKAGMVIRVSIRKFPATPDRYTVQLSKSLGMSALPVPDDVSFVEADLISGEPRLVATTSLNLAQTRDFYDRELSAQGWLPRARGTSIKEKNGWLNYIRGQRDLTIGLVEQADQSTLIRVGEQLENLSWQLKKNEPATSPATAGEKPAVGIEAADFPLLAGTNSLAIDLDRKELAFKIEAIDSAELVKQYLDRMQQLGWKTTREGIREATYVFLTFGKEAVELDLRANIREGVATVSVEGDGLLWNKRPQIAPQLISYESWLRTHHHPASMKLLDAFETEMRPLVSR